MSRISWNAPEGRFFDTGLDRGVLYPKGTPPLSTPLATNLIPNPSFGVNTTGWIANSNTSIARSTAQAYVGSACLALTATGAGGQVSAYTANLTVVPGVKYTFSVYLRGATVGRSANMQINWINSVGGYLSSSYGVSVSTTTTGWTRAFVTGFAPTGAVTAYAFPNVAASGVVVGEVHYMDAAMLNTDVLIPYFDGDTLDTGLISYEWTGVAGSSSSVKREIQTKAVPWMGLQSVDEEGGESAAAYYIDGRPFLFLPKPKEFKANLKAITYPDAFYEIMGVQEVADGMYLDSQPGDTFDLSYRTLVGNGLDGLDHGYKIHLIYNCSVAPQSTTYESTSAEINPTSFAWEIQAVPVPVEGFRSTAHIIIDTRHMQQSKIDAVEAMLYGSETTLSNMPSPQVIFDLLSYGDTIIVTDNGDGTFDVTGSYENVYMIDEGVFRVDNVDGQDNGNGTFTISTTT